MYVKCTFRYPFRDLPRADTEATTGSKRLPILLRRAWYALNQGFRERIDHLGLTPNQFTILRWLSEGDPKGLSQRALADLMASDPNTVSDLLGRMQKAGLIARVPDERDRRASRVQLEPKGRALFEEARVIALDLQNTLLAGLPEERREGFLEALESIAGACAALVEKG